VFGLVPTWQAIEALDNVVADEVQSQMLNELGRRTVRATTWFLRSPRLAEPMEATIAGFAPAARHMFEFIAGAAGRGRVARSDRRSARSPGSQSRAFRTGARRRRGPRPRWRRSTSRGRQCRAAAAAEVAASYFAVGELLGLARLRGQVAALPADSYWQGLAKTALNDDLAGLQRQITATP